MARLKKHELRKKGNREALIAVLGFMRLVTIVLQFYMLITKLITAKRGRRRQGFQINLPPNALQNQVDNLNRLVRGCDKHCHKQLRVNRHVFMRLCHLLTERGLADSRNVLVV